MLESSRASKGNGIEQALSKSFAEPPFVGFEVQATCVAVQL